MKRLALYNGSENRTACHQWSDVPTQVANVRGAVAVASGGQHSCAALGDGSLFCWGQNDVGQLGDGTSDPLAFRSLPEAVVGLTDVTSIAAGRSHTCAVTVAGRAWGSNTNGQLGNATLRNSTHPVAVVAN